MAYGNKYILSFSNELNQFYEIYFDYLDYTGSSSPIIGAESSFVIKSNSDPEDRFAPILGLQCDINIFVGTANTPQGVVDDSQVTIYDLIAEQDNQIRVTIYKDNDHTKSIFQGFVIVQDNSQPFLDPPFLLTVSCLDGLGLLRGVDFVDLTGAPFAAAYSPIKWIAQMLYKTDQALNIRVYFNIENTTYPITPPIESFKISSTTFQTGQPQTTTDPTIDIAASIADDCYTVLEKLVRNLRCRLFQQDGVWNLVNVWEYQNSSGYSYVEYEITDVSAGIVFESPVDNQRNLNYDIQVGSDQLIHPVKDDVVISLKLATKSEKLTYTYDQSLNKVCNQDLSQGTAAPSFDGTISSTIEDPTITPVVTFETKGYDAFCWTIKGGTAATAGLTGTVPYPEVAPTSNAYIRSVLDQADTEENRYMVIENATLATHARSSVFLIDINDNLEVSFDFRTRLDLGSPTTLITMWILLDGIDGTKWGYGGLGVLGPYGWYELDANYQISAGEPYPPPVYKVYSAGEPTSTWTNISISTNAAGGLMKVPVSGNAFLILAGQPAAPAIGSTGGVEAWFKNIQVTIRPYLQGSFVQLKGDYNFSSSTLQIKQTLTDSVEISDSPKRYFKGAILQTDGQSLMPPTWVRSGVMGATAKRFTQLMEQIMYNALYRQFQKIEGTFRGLTWVDSTYTVREAGFINSYFFSNHPIPTKKFMLTSFENDYGTGQGRRVYLEILNDQNDTGQVEPTSFIFQYLFQ